MQALPKGLYAILDPDQCGGRDPLQYGKALLGAGVRLLQLRDKGYRAKRALELARALNAMCRRSGALLIVNDRLDVALLSDASGLHLGPGDLPVDAARKALGPEALIGRSTNSLEEALAAEQAGASYLAFGPLYETSSKTGSPLRERRELDLLRELCSRTSLPVYGIGGITEERAAQVAQAGAAGAAVIAALSKSGNLPVTVDRLGAPWRSLGEKPTG